MIKVTVQYNDHLVDIHFPCSETTLWSALMEIHAADDNPPELFVTDVIFPEELDHLKDRFVNLDELNYLAKRMESFFGKSQYDERCPCDYHCRQPHSLPGESEVKEVRHERKYGIGTQGSHHRP